MAESLSDATLLERFVSGREEAAFATLVRRHGPRVERICRRILHNEHDVEDVLQATFLVLSRKAAGISWHESVSPWLDGVARRLAMHARSGAARQRDRETTVTALAGGRSHDDGRLPERYHPAVDPSAEVERRDVRRRHRRRAAEAAREVPGAGGPLRPGGPHPRGGRPPARLADRFDVPETRSGPDPPAASPDLPRAGPRHPRGGLDGDRRRRARPRARPIRAPRGPCDRSCRHSSRSRKAARAMVPSWPRPPGATGSRPDFARILPAAREAVAAARRLERRDSRHGQAPSGAGSPGT